MGQPRGHTGLKTPRVLDGCADCLAWGLTYCQGICMDCYNFAAPQRNYPVGACRCGLVRKLKDGYCRLCWCQAREDRKATGDARSQVMIAPHLPMIRFQQLFFAGMHGKRIPPPREAPRRYGEKGRPRKSAPVPVRRPSSGCAQLPLFSQHIARDYARRRFDLRSADRPDNPWLSYALYLAHGMAERRGWKGTAERAMQRVLVTLLAGHSDGDIVRASEVRPVAIRYNINPDLVLEVLDAMLVLEDDRVRAFDRWLEKQIAGLAPAIGDMVCRWALTVADGGPRSRPRSTETAQGYLRVLMPALILWSQRFHHLREVRASDITAFLATAGSRERAYAMTALRALFGWAKKSKLIFRNPTARIAVPKPAAPVWQLLTPQDIYAAVTAATTLQAQVYIVLSAVHAARPSHIRAMHLDDINLGTGRMTIAGNSRPLDGLTYQVIAEWLRYRQEHWPATANPHLLVSPQTALGYGPVSTAYLGKTLTGLPAGPDRLRIHRILEEAVTNGADPLGLSVVFGIDDATAVKYALNAKQLLGTMSGLPERQIAVSPVGLRCDS